MFYEMACTNSEDPNQITPDQGLLCLLFHQVFCDATVKSFGKKKHSKTDATVVTQH